MKYKFIATICVVTALPLLAQAQQRQSPPNAPSGPKPTAADVQRVVSIITADKAKTQVYCDIAKLDDQIAQAEQRKDNKRAELLAGQAEQMAQKLGPEYVKLMDSLQQIDPSSSEGQQMVTAFEPLEKLCTRK